MGDKDKDIDNRKDERRKAKKSKHVYALICTNNYLGTALLLTMNLEKNPAISLSLSSLSLPQEMALHGVTTLSSSSSSSSSPNLCFIGSYLQDSFLLEIQSERKLEEEEEEGKRERKRKRNKDILTTTITR